MLNVALSFECTLQDIDIKKQGGLTAYAFVQFDDIASVVSALRDMDGEHIGNNEIKVWYIYFSRIFDPGKFILIHVRNCFLVA